MIPCQLRFSSTSETWIDAHIVSFVFNPNVNRSERVIVIVRLGNGMLREKNLDEVKIP